MGGKPHNWGREVGTVERELVTNLADYELEEPRMHGAARLACLARAKGRVGKGLRGDAGDYDPIARNCEHFADFCRRGAERARSDQGALAGALVLCGGFALAKEAASLATLATVAGGVWFLDRLLVSTPTPPCERARSTRRRSLCC